jgi:hypothetical protein
LPWKPARSNGRAAHNQPPARDRAVDDIGVFDAAIHPALRDPPSFTATRPRYSDAAVLESTGALRRLSIYAADP